MRTLPFQGNRKIKCATISPLGLALTACGGGGTKEPEVITEINRHSEFVTFDLTGNDFIDASTQGSKWVPTDGVITFALADGFNGERWENPDEALESLSSAMQQIADMTNLKVKNLGHFGNPEIAGEMGATIVASLDSQNEFFDQGSTDWAKANYPLSQNFDESNTFEGYNDFQVIIKNK